MDVEKLEEMIKELAKKEGTEDRFAVRDLLTDLRVVCDTLGVDFDVAVEGSLEVYNIEQE